MTELKTLKEISLPAFQSIEIRKLLKVEAVKRWKFAKEKENETDDINLQLYWRGRMDELEENFNLEEEDLK